MSRALLLALVACRGTSAPPPAFEVTTQLPGENAASVTTNLERVLTTVVKMAGMTSSTRDGVSKITVELDRNADVLAAMNEASTELTRFSRAMPPGTMPPLVMPQAHFLARYVLPDLPTAKAFADAVVVIPGISGRPQICDAKDVPTVIELDPARLRERGLTVVDALEGIELDYAHSPLDAVIGKQAVKVGDIATIHPGSTPACRAAGAGTTVVELSVAPNGLASGELIDRIEKATKQTPFAATHDIVVSLRDEADHAAALRDAAASVSDAGPFLVEQRTGELAHVIVTGATAAVADKLAALPFVAGAGEPALVVGLSGDLKQIAAVADRLAARHALIATRGLAHHTVKTVKLSQAKVADLALQSYDISQTLAVQIAGVRVQRDYLVTVSPEVPLVVRGRNGIVPLDSVVDFEERDEPIEAIHIDVAPGAWLYLRDDDLGDVGALKVKR